MVGETERTPASRVHHCCGSEQVISVRNAVVQRRLVNTIAIAEKVREAPVGEVKSPSFTAVRLLMDAVLSGSVSRREALRTQNDASVH